MHTLVVRTKAFCYYATTGCSRQQEFKFFHFPQMDLNLDLVLTTNSARILKEFGVRDGRVYQANLERVVEPELVGL